MDHGYSFALFIYHGSNLSGTATAIKHTEPEVPFVRQPI